MMQTGMAKNIGLRKAPNSGAAASLVMDFFNTPSLITPVGNISFTRTTDATIDDQDSIIRSALSGEARFRGMRRVRNFLTNPENIAAWTPVANGTGSAPTITANYATAPDGTATAGRIQCTLNGGATASDQSYAQLGSSAFTAGNSVVRSCWIKSNTGSSQQVLLVNGGADAAHVVTCTATWQRLSTPPSTNQNSFTIGLRGTVANGPLDILVWHPQWENVQGQTIQTPGEYVSVGVLSTPFHGAGVDGVKYFSTLNGNTVSSNVVTEATGAAISSSIRQGLLIEPAATNLILQSNAFTTTWTALNAPTITQNQTGPDGLTSAWTLTDSSAVATSFIYQTLTLAAVTYTQSVFVKKTSGATTFPVFGADRAAPNVTALCTIDTNNGIATVWTAYTGFSIAVSSATCVSFNANYWRVTLTFAGSAGNWNIAYYPAATTNATQATGIIDVTVTGSSGASGVQLETGSIATSYTPTTTVSVTRNADVATIATGSWYNALAGTLYAEWLAPSYTANNFIASINDTTTNNEIFLFSGTVANCSYGVTAGGAGQAAFLAGVVTPGAINKTIGIYALNDFAGYTNNALTGAPDNNGTIPNVTRLEIGARQGTLQLNSTIRKIAYYPVRLINEVAKALTV